MPKYKLSSEERAVERKRKFEKHHEMSGCEKIDDLKDEFKLITMWIRISDNPQNPNNC